MIAMIAAMANVSPMIIRNFGLDLSHGSAIDKIDMKKSVQGQVLCITLHSAFRYFAILIVQLLMQFRGY